MKKSILVALADRNYINQAKQLFSSVYFNSGWTGDYLLLSHDIPEKDLKWFRKKGIIVKKVKPLKKLDDSRWPSVILSKFYMFTPYFRQWKNVVYLDSDIIVRCSLDELANIKGFVAPVDFTYNLRGQFKSRWKEDELYKKLKERYNTKKKAFNVGIMAFSTDIIKENVLDEFMLLYKEYYPIIKYPEQCVLNIYFYNNWKILSGFYCIIPKPLLKGAFPLILPLNKRIISYQKKSKGILHFIGEYKPWNKRNYFYKEWEDNLNKADKIDLKNILDIPKKYKGGYLLFKIHYFACLYLNFFDKIIGKISQGIKKRIPITKKILTRKW